MPQLMKPERPTPEEINASYREKYITAGERNDKMRKLAKMTLDDTIGEQGMVKTYVTQWFKHVEDNWNDLIDIASKHDPTKSTADNLLLPLRLMWREIGIIMAPITAFGEVNRETVKHWALDAGLPAGLADVIGIAAEVGSGFVPVGKLSQSFAQGVQAIGAKTAAKTANKAAAAEDAAKLAQAEKFAEDTIKGGLATDGAKIADTATDTVRLYRGQAGAFKPVSLDPPLGQGERGRWFTSDIEAAKFYGDDLVFVDVPKAIADAAKVPDSLLNKTGRLLPAEWANKAQAFTKSAGDSFWNQFNAIKKELAGITETKSFEMAAKEADKLGLTGDDIRKLFPGKAINDTEVVALLRALGTSEKVGTPVAEWVKVTKAFDPQRPETVDAFLNTTLDMFNLTTKMRTTNVTAGRSVKYFDQAPANKSINELLRHWDPENMAKLDRTAAAQTMVEDILAIADEPGKLSTLAVAANDAVANAGPTAWSKIREAYVGLLLLRPVTWTRQAIGNSLAALTNTVEKETGALFSIDQKKGLVRGDGLEDLLGMRMAMAEASKAYLDAYKFNPAAQSRLDFPIHRIGGAFGRAINVGSDTVRGLDNFAKTLIYNGEVYASAFRDAAHLGLEPTSKAYASYIARRRVMPTIETQERAADIAAKLTFQSELGYLGSKAQQLLQAGPLAAYFPFVKSGMNLVKWGWNRTPGLQLASQSLYDDILAGGVRADMAVARLTLSNMFGQYFFGMFNTGMGTGGGPVDPAERRSWEAAHRKYSFRGPGGTWYSFENTMEPGTTPLEMYADLAEIANQLDDMSLEQGALAVSLIVQRDILSNTWWQNAGKIAEVTGALAHGESPRRPGAELLAAPLTAIATGGPLGLALEREFDPVRREARSWTDSLRKGPFARVFGYDEQMPPLRDGYGDPILVPQAVGSEWLRRNGWVAGDFLAGLNNIGNPFTVKPAETDRIKIEGDRLQIKMPAFPWSTGGGTVRDDFDLRSPLPGEAVPVPLTPQQRDKWIRIYRNLVRTVNGGIEKTLLDTPQYKNAPLALQRDMFANYLAKSRDLAKKTLLVDDLDLAKQVIRSSAAKYLPMFQPDERAQVEGKVEAAVGLLDTLLPQQRENLLKFGILDDGAKRDNDIILRRFSDEATASDSGVMVDSPAAPMVDSPAAPMVGGGILNR